MAVKDGLGPRPVSQTAKRHFLNRLETSSKPWLFPRFYIANCHPARVLLEPAFVLHKLFAPSGILLLVRPPLTRSPCWRQGSADFSFICSLWAPWWGFLKHFSKCLWWDEKCIDGIDVSQWLGHSVDLKLKPSLWLQVRNWFNRDLHPWAIHVLPPWSEHDCSTRMNGEQIEWGTLGWL